MGALDGGITVGAILGGSKLLQVWGDAKQKFGLDNPSTIKRHQDRIRQRWEAKADSDWIVESDLSAADERLAAHLLDSLPPAKELSMTIVDGEPYPAKAARMIVDHLAKRDDCVIFREEGQMGASVTARAFALEVVEASLESALAEPEYSQKLFPWFLTDIAQAVHRVEKAIEAADAGSQQRDAHMEAMLSELVEAKRASAEVRGVNAAKLIALAQRIVEKVADANLAERALDRAIDELIELRENVARGTNFGREIDDAIKRVFARIEANDFEGAQDQGEEELVRIQERESELKAAKVRIAITSFEAARLAYDAKKMAYWVTKKMSYESGGREVTALDVAAALGYWYHYAARISGSRLDMDLAIELGRLAVRSAHDVDTKIACLNALANALRLQGERLGGANGMILVDEAISSCREAGKLATRDESPENWAITHVNLGTALSTLAKSFEDQAGVDLLGSGPIKSLAETLIS